MLINFKQVEAILNKSYLIAKDSQGMHYAIAFIVALPSHSFHFHESMVLTSKRLGPFDYVRGPSFRDRTFQV